MQTSPLRECELIPMVYGARYMTFGATGNASYVVCSVCFGRSTLSQGCVGDAGPRTNRRLMRHRCRLGLPVDADHTARTAVGGDRTSAAGAASSRHRTDRVIQPRSH